MTMPSSEQANHPCEFVPKYDLSEIEINSLSTKLFSEQPPVTKDRFVCYALAGNDEFSNLGRSVELGVFSDTFGNDTELMEREYGPYEYASEFFVVMDQRKALPIGALRVIKNSESGLKTLNDIQSPPLEIDLEDFKQYHNVDNLDKVWDVGTVAVLQEYRMSAMKSQMMSIMLYRAMYVKAVKDNIDHFVAIIDTHAHKGLDMLGVPFVPINGSEPFSYLDSLKSTALYGYVPDFYKTMDERLKRIQDKHPIKSIPLSIALGGLMLGKHIDNKLQFLYK